VSHGSVVSASRSRVLFFAAERYSTAILFVPGNITVIELICNDRLLPLIPRRTVGLINKLYQQRKQWRVERVEQLTSSFKGLFIHCQSRLLSSLFCRFGSLTNLWFVPNLMIALGRVVELTHSALRRPAAGRSRWPAQLPHYSFIVYFN
jgi:hypothetical protein